ncbi:MAG: zf-HC2 domain-containing protein [Verrucomicrobia bacterium]|nr:zf-HC2 domain-containing protein [Verrucomicrobiota bacterium]
MPQPAPTDHYTPEEWSAYADGEAPVEQREMMRLHAMDCPDCAGLMRSYKELQQGAEDLLRHAEPPRPELRERVLTTGKGAMAEEHTRLRWQSSIGRLFAAVIAIGLVIYAWNLALSPGEAPAVVINRVLISRYFVEPPSLDYDIGIANPSGRPVTITRAITRDPLGGELKDLHPPLQISGGKTAVHILGRKVPESAHLVPGTYEITLVTSHGTVSARTTVEKEK